MSGIKIKAEECSIAKIFSDDFVFSIPEFQRPYAWTEKEAGELFDDLIAALGTTHRTIKEIDPYFLGSIVLIKEESQPEAQVVDGQQRLTTLVILLSVLREIIQNQEFVDEITPFLQSRGNRAMGTESHYRLELRKDRDFFKQYIQEPKQINELEKLNNNEYSDSAILIKENALLFLNKLDEFSQRDCTRLVQFILQRCSLVVISNSDISSACRIFSVLNGRGLNLSMTDILKADIIRKIPEDKGQRDEYARKWEDIEELLGRESFDSLFINHIWGIFDKEQPSPRNKILESLRTQIEEEQEPDILIDRILIPAAKALSAIEKNDYSSSAEVEILLKWLNQIDVNDWKSPAILFLFNNWNEPQQVLKFFSDMERLVIGFKILKSDAKKIRNKRYLQLSRDIRDNKDIFREDSPLQLTPKERENIIRVLESNSFYQETKNGGVRSYILRRLDICLAGSEEIYKFPSITIEHVLPQNPANGSEWLAWFPSSKQREQYIHKLGNLVLLSKRKNRDAGRLDFEKKKKIYFSKDGSSPFALTTQVLQEKKWTREVINRRQKQLIKILKELWRL